MNNRGVEAVGGCCIVCVFLVVALAAWAGLTMGLAWLVCFAADGMFGRELPYWPTVASVVLVQFLVTLLRGVVVRAGKE